MTDQAFADKKLGQLCDLRAKLQKKSGREAACGTFIVLEGIDGSGTTTQALYLAQILSSMGHEVCLTKEPTDSAIGKLIREMIKDPEVSPVALALLFAADRREHLRTVIQPALARGEIVICDRYVDSSYAYQSQSVPIEWLERINSNVRPPDLTIFLDIPVAVALDRIEYRGNEKDRFENQEFLERVSRTYKMFYDESITVDGGQLETHVHHDVLKVVDDSKLLAGR